MCSSKRGRTASVWLALPRKPIIVYGESKGWGNSPTMSFFHADDLALADGLGAGANSFYCWKLKPHFYNRRWLTDTLGSKQDSSVTYVFRPCLKPFRIGWNAITNR